MKLNSPVCLQPNTFHNFKFTKRLFLFKRKLLCVKDCFGVLPKVCLGRYINAQP